MPRGVCLVVLIVIFVISRSAGLVDYARVGNRGANSKRLIVEGNTTTSILGTA